MQELRPFPGADGRILPGLRRPPPQPSLKCPRCDSLDTKFCYFNNYNLSQPRHFCRSCRRYWTKGGVLRNVPVGGGCRKSSKRSQPTTTPSSPSRPHKRPAPSPPPEPVATRPALAPHHQPPPPPPPELRLPEELTSIGFGDPTLEWPGALDLSAGFWSESDPSLFLP